MHELSVCLALIDQVEKVAQSHHATSVDLVVLQIGPLSGVEASLLKHAFPLAVAGTLAEKSVLEIELLSIKVHCMSCGKDSDAVINRLVCGHCGDYKTQLISGEEFLLKRVGLVGIEEAENQGVAHV